MNRSILHLIVFAVLLAGCAASQSETGTATPDTFPTATAPTPTTADPLYPPARNAINRYEQARRGSNYSGMEAALADVRRIAAERPDDARVQVLEYAVLHHYVTHRARQDMLPEVRTLHATLKERMPSFLREVPPPSYAEASIYKELAYQQTDDARAKAYQDKRRQALQRAVKENPDHGKTHLELASYHIYHGSKEVARMEAQRASDLMGEKAEVYLTLGRLSAAKIHDPDDCWDRQALDDAIAHFKHAIQIDPSDARAHDGLANGYRHKGAYDLAVFESREAARLNPAPVYKRELANRLVYTGNIDEAIAILDSLVQQTPENEDNHNWLAWAYFAEGNYASAAKHYREWYDASSGDWFYGSLNFALSLQGSGSADEAQRVLAKLKPTADEKREKEWESVLIAYHRGELDQDELLKRATNRCRLTDAHFYTGLQYEFAGNRTKARQHYEHAVAQKVFCYFDHAVANAALNRLAGAQETG